MYSLMYLSEALTPVSPLVLHSIWKTSSYNNKNNGITGYLCYSNGFFIQYIEGEADNIKKLIKNIKNDIRHHILYSVEKENVTQRHFPNWSMELISNKRNSHFELDDSISSLIDDETLFHIDNDDCEKELVEELFWKHLSSVNQQIQSLQTKVY